MTQPSFLLKIDLSKSHLVLIKLVEVLSFSVYFDEPPVVVFKSGVGGSEQFEAKVNTSEVQRLSLGVLFHVIIVQTETRRHN